MEETRSIALFSVSFVTFEPLWSIGEEALEERWTTETQRTQRNGRDLFNRSFLCFVRGLRAFVVNR